MGAQFPLSLSVEILHHYKPKRKAGNNMKKYITYEEPYANQTFTESEMRDVYNTNVNKSEYPDFTDWLHDMLKSGVFESI